MFVVDKFVRKNYLRFVLSTRSVTRLLIDNVMEKGSYKLLIETILEQQEKTGGITVKDETCAIESKEQKITEPFAAEHAKEVTGVGETSTACGLMGLMTEIAVLSLFGWAIKQAVNVIQDNLMTCPELFRPVCMSKCRKMWKDHKNKMKMQHWKPHQDAPDILERVPTGILPDQWTQLVRYWTSEEAQREADRNARNRALQGPAHRLGTRHITQVRHELRSKGYPVDRMSVWMQARDHRHPEVAAILAQYQSRLEQLPEDQRHLPSRRDEIFHSIIGRDGHGYTLTYGTGIPRSHIARAESSGASSSQGLRYRTDEEITELLQSMTATIREEVTATIREEVRAEMRAEMASLEARLSQSRGPLSSDPPPTTQAPDAGSSHRARPDSAGEGTHDLAGSMILTRGYEII